MDDLRVAELRITNTILAVSIVIVLIAGLGLLYLSKKIDLIELKLDRIHVKMGAVYE